MNLEDIAQKAGVSRSTVSRVINNERYVSEDVRQRVLQVIAEENFLPNPAARTLVTRRSNIIGVAIPQTTSVFFGDNSYYPMLLQGIAETLNQCDYSMLMWLAVGDDERQSFAERVIRHRQPDGLIITSIVESDPLFSYMLEHNRRFVMVEQPPRGEERISFVTIDNVAAAANAVAHLIALGRRRIATITGGLDIRDAQDRLKGYRLALTQAGLPIDERLIHPGLFRREVGREGMRALLPLQPDAVFCGGDTIAAGALEVLREHGVKVPDDIAVVGFDNLDVAEDYSLTTVHHAVQQVGSTAAQLLIDLIEGRLEHPHHIVLPTELIVRGSTVSQT